MYINLYVSVSSIRLQAIPWEQEPCYIHFLPAVPGMYHELNKLVEMNCVAKKPWCYNSVWPFTTFKTLQAPETFKWLHLRTSTNVIFCYFSFVSETSFWSCKRQREESCLQLQLIIMTSPFSLLGPQASWAKCWWRSYFVPALTWKSFTSLWGPSLARHWSRGFSVS